MKKIVTWIVKWLCIFWRAIKIFYHEDYTYHSSALAFITILAIVPVLSVLVYAFSISSQFSNILTLLNNYIYANFLPSSVQLVQKQIDQFAIQASRLPTAGILFSFLTGLMLLYVIEQTLNQIWRVQHIKRHLTARLIALMVLMLLPIYVGLSSLLIEFIYTKIEISYFQYATINILNLIINASIFAVFYIVVPNKLIGWREGVVGGLITAILFEIVKKVFVWYVSYFSNYAIVYGALATIPIFLSWLYVSWVIFLYGAVCMQVKASLRNKSL